MLIARSPSVIPFSVNPIALNYQGCEIFVWDHDARRVSVFIKDGLICSPWMLLLLLLLLPIKLNTTSRVIRDRPLQFIELPLRVN